MLGQLIEPTKSHIDILIHSALVKKMDAKSPAIAAIYVVNVYQPMIAERKINTNQ